MLVANPSACCQSRETVCPWVVATQSITIDECETSALACFARLAFEIWDTLVLTHRVACYRYRAVCTNVCSTADTLPLKTKTLATAVRWAS